MRVDEPRLPPLSVAIVCRNNEGTIGRTLESIRGLACEIVAVDSGSTDRTVAMLEAMRGPGCEVRVIHSEWLGHVKTKQKALEACTQPWILCLDSDESLLPGLAASVRRVIAEAPADLQACSMNRMVFYRDIPLRHAWQPEWRVRLVRKGAAAWQGLDPHDQLVRTAPGREERIEGTMRHDSISTFREFFAKQVSHARVMAGSLHTAGNRGSRLRILISPPGAFFKQLVLKRGFLDGRAGWLAAASTALGALVKHAALLEMTIESERKPQA